MLQKYRPYYVFERARHNIYCHNTKISILDQSAILIVDDDEDDLSIIEAVVKHLQIKRPVKCFRNGDSLLNYLRTISESPFLIICDVNLPGENGFDVKKRITDDKELRYKSVPFIFWSTIASEKDIQKAYDLPAQGFFFKPNIFDELCNTFRIITSYWGESKHPKQVQ